MMESGSAKPAETKKELRRQLLALRDGLSEAERAEASRLACRQAAEWIEASGIGSVMAFVSFRSELDTSPLLEYCWARGLRLLLPRADIGSKRLELHAVRSRDELAPGAYGILEPRPGRAAAAREAPEAIFVPGAGFDRSGGRIGYGGGYYDRFRAEGRAAAGAAWIGLGFASQLVPQVPMEPHDAPLDGVITEQGLIWTTSNPPKGGRS
ncbi:5-formyltetrahydrofolate cyclo-ligase [Paenibacillus albicereus]|uniref:5-formyltetrahydrofolate cyclo-ligase n=1 Tax=Paenibacillus albicereus TaxID=2726185 RepID=A0A6H2GVI5_9BACL|nr:5-formyltetrahydrofolate cyclo-ligase [Paenibacillus albicereus]QJC51176.1 5-formyltetrahydrofolate cyclo-ligase [Paenibacillus albicereus]